MGMLYVLMLTMIQDGKDSPLIAAAREGHKQIVKYLLEVAKADHCLKNKQVSRQAYTPALMLLHWVALNAMDFASVHASQVAILA